MNESEPSLEAVRCINLVCEMFEAAWKAGRRGPVEAFLKDLEHLASHDRETSPSPITAFFHAATDVERNRLITELAAIEIHQRRQHGETITLEEYRTRFGSLADEIPFDETEFGLRSGADQRTAQLAPLSAGQNLGPYELVQQVGIGAFGEVWRATDVRLKRTIAIKTPRSDLFFTQDELDRFCAEAQRAAQLRHPCIAAVHDVGKAGNRPYIVYEFVSGESLRDLLTRGRIAENVALNIFRQICEGVDCAHRAGVIHRDLKPGNILIDLTGVPRVVDFGMAKMPTADLSLVITGQIAGTPQYMSPEQAAGATTAISKATDVYALGVILYELVSGQKPFHSTTSDLLRRIREESPPPLRERDPGADPRLDAICARAMAKKPEHRFGSAGELGQAVGAYLDGAQLCDTIVIRKPGEAGRRRQWIALAAGVTSVAVLAVVLAFFGKAETFNVRVVTKPARARVVLWEINPETNEPDPEKRHEAGRSPVDIALPPGRYLVVAALDGQRFQEVYRTVPAKLDSLSEAYPHSFWEYDKRNDVIHWQEITIPASVDLQNMKLVEVDAPFTQGFETSDDHDLGRRPAPRLDAPPLKVALRSFWIDSKETSWADYLAVNGDYPRSRPPQLPAPADDDPATMNWVEAMDFAERSGKRLMTEAEYEYVATNRGRTLFPWGDDPDNARPWTIHSVKQAGFDVTSDPPNISGLFSNAGEWTVTALFLPASQSIGGINLTLPPDAVLGRYILRGFPPNVNSSTDLSGLSPASLDSAMEPDSGIPWTDRGARLRRGSSLTDAHGLHAVRSVKPRLERGDLQATLFEDDVR
jgi:hypothetical protein